MSAPRTKLFVGHLPDGCTNEDLETLFSKYGTVSECDVINKYGFVHMSTSEEAEDAMKALNNYNFKGSSLSVERSKSKLHPEPGAPGRAKGGMPNRGGFGFRGGFGSPRGGGGGGYSNGYGRFNGGSPYGGRGGGSDFYSDRGYGGMGARMRPYPSPYDRPSMAPMRDDYYRSPYASALRDPYRPSPPPSRDLYERRVASYPTANDYLYSRRSPTPQIPASSRPYFYDSVGESGSGPIPNATRRGYF